MLLGALDLGSNSFHLLVARANAEGRLEKVTGRKATIRLAEVVATTGRIEPATFTRALDAVGELLAHARRHGAKRVLVAGTSALREAENGAAFAAAVEERHGAALEILSGEEEGRLVYHGARARLEALPERVGVLDLGGGSLEIAIGDGPSCLLSRTLPLGFLRLARTLDVHGGLDPVRLERVRAHLDGAAASVEAEVRALAPRAWLLSGGTARALAGTVGVEPGAAISTRQLGLWVQRFAPCDPSQLIGLGVEPARARGFALGILVLATLAERLGAPATRITPGGLREGLILREINGRSTRHGRVHLHDAGRLARPSAG